MSAPHTQFADWRPVDGATVHLSRRNRWQLPAGRYIVDSWQGRAWQLRCIASGARQAVCGSDLIEEAQRGPLTPIGADELERERQQLDLRRLAPMRGRGHRQHDASNLALFRAANEPRLL